MSSILKALKKLESESAAKIEMKSSAQTLDTGKVVQNSLSKGQGSIKAATYCILFLGVIVVLGYVLSQNQGKQQESGRSESLSQLNEEVSVTPYDSKDFENTEERQPGELKNASKSIQQSGHNAILAQQERDGEKEMLSTQPAVPDAKEREHRGTVSQVTSRSNSQVSEKEPVVKKEVVSGQQVEKVEHPLYPRLDFSILELQAITWADDPRERFALVENRILRKNESIKGYIVDSIYEDYVVVQQGGEKWRVEFRLR